MDGLREGYDYFARNSVSYFDALEAGVWVDKIDKAIDKLRFSLEAYEGDGRDLNKLGGYIAEEWHKGTFNIDAAIKDSSDRAHIPPARKLASVDIHLDSGADFSLKYYKSADESLKQQAMTYGEKARSKKNFAEARRAIEGGKANEGDLLYQGQRRLIPSDQLADAQATANRRIREELTKRPEQAERYRKAMNDKLTDRVSNDKGVESMSLTKQDDLDLAADLKAGKVDLAKYGISKQQRVQFQDVMRKSLKAGMSAAIVAAVLAAAPTVIEAIDYLVTIGHLDLDRLRTAGTDALSGGAQGFLAGASSAAIVGAVGTGILGNAPLSLDPAIVGAAAVVLVNAISNSAKVASGNMKPAEMLDALARDSFVATAAIVLGGATQALLPQLPVLGYLLGSFVGSAAAGFAYGAGKKATIALCVHSGFTMFGLVEQDYELPEAAIREIGADVLEYETFEFDSADVDSFEPDGFLADVVSPNRIGITFLRRGVVSVAKVGYTA